MAAQRTSCVYDGDTFIGTFSESSRGPDATVTVRYGDQERTTPLGSVSAGHAAQRLLSELIQDHLAVESALSA